MYDMHGMKFDTRASANANRAQTEQSAVNRLESCLKITAPTLCYSLKKDPSRDIATFTDLL